MTHRQRQPIFRANRPVQTTSSFSFRRTMGVLGALLLVGTPGLVGCASVEPSHDFERTGAAIRERVGVRDVYDPAIESLIDDKVGALLTGGLTTDEAIRVALLNNRAFQALFQTIAASRADVVQSQLLSNPTFSILTRFPEGGGRANLTMGFGQELVDLWQIPVRRGIAESQLEQAVLNVVQRGVEIATETRIGSYRLLAAERARSIGDENTALVERSLKAAGERLRGGEANQIEVNLVRSSVLDVKTEQVGLQRDARIAKAQLAQLLGLSRWTRSWEMRDSLPACRDQTTDVTQLVLFAMSERLDGQVAAMRAQAAEQEVRKQYLKVFPSVTLGAEWERMERRALPGRRIVADTARSSVAAGQLTAPTIQSRAERRLERSQIIDSLLGPSLQITVPIWDQNQAQIARAQAEARERRKEYESLLDSVATEVETALAALRAAQTQAQLYVNESIPLGEQNVEAARRAYQAGEQNILVLLETQSLLIRQRLAYVNAVRDCAIARAELQKAAGGRLPDETERPGTTRPVAVIDGRPTTAPTGHRTN